MIRTNKSIHYPAESVPPGARHYRVTLAGYHDQRCQCGSTAITTIDLVIWWADDDCVDWSDVDGWLLDSGPGTEPLPESPLHEMIASAFENSGAFAVPGLIRWLCTRRTRRAG